MKTSERWPEAKSESKYWKNEGGVDEVEDTDGEDEGSGVPGPGGPVDEKCHYHHQVKTTINDKHIKQSYKQSSRDSYQTPSREKITAITEANAKNMLNFYRFHS